MIATALKLLRDELSNYVVSNKRPDDTILKDDIILHNIALLEGASAEKLQDKIIISLVNTEEESTLKNTSHVLKTINGIKYKEPPVFLNLYILITATLKDNATPDNYEFALHRLSLAIQFFQAKKLFTVNNSPNTTIANDSNVSETIKEELKLTVELYTLTFEQINHLWGSLGGKQTPFSMYKVRMVKIQEITSVDSPVIEEIIINDELINADCDD